MRSLITAALLLTFAAPASAQEVVVDVDLMREPLSLTEAAWSKRVQPGRNATPPDCSEHGINVGGVEVFTPSGQSLAVQTFNERTRNNEWVAVTGRVIWTGGKFKNRTTAAVRVATYC